MKLNVVGHCTYKVEVRLYLKFGIEKTNPTKTINIQGTEGGFRGHLSHLASVVFTD